MASSRKDFTVWEDENKENLVPEKRKILKRSASVSDSLSMYKSESTRSCVNVEKKISGVCAVINENNNNNNNNNVRVRHHSLTSKQPKRGVENVKFMEKRLLWSYDCKEKCIFAGNEENENANKSRSSASTSKFEAQTKIDKGKLKLNVKSSSLGSTGRDNNWRKIYHPRILTIQQNEGSITPVDLSIPPFLEKVKELHKRNTKDVSVEVSTDKLQLDANTKSAVSKISCDLDEADKYIEMQFEREKSRGIAKYLRNPFVVSRKREIIVDFLMRVNTYRGDPPFILYQTVKILDAAFNAMKPDVEDLQVIALAAMWISIKRDNVNIPTATSMIAFGGDEFKEKGNILIKFECRILQALNFDISYPDISSVLAHFIFKHYGTSNDEPRVDITYDCGNFFIDIAIFDVCLCTGSAILLAGVAAILALFLVENPNEFLPKYFQNQFSRLPYADKFLYGEAVFVRETLIERAFKWRDEYNTGSSTFKKYANKRYRKIKEFLLENVNRLKYY
ncbi:uncharacterized protein LOC107272054 isoform X2 [Cephus cinctus]|uniref:Uncharacterized protein LOC107272054 isoform X2 n=1 Tax=Cephus cinctus TaxID=211228 RepID=A0AAJ7C861_CEPCN|nr:uncharacterized protein LOC107272054 isoform X2 [Cephus cinctus]